MRVLDLVDPTHTQAIGLVFSDRDPLTPMANALLASSGDLHLPEDLENRV